MKKKLLIILGVITLVFLSGCSKDTNHTSMTAYTSVYPVKYILDNLYGDVISSDSIYPAGTNYQKYDLNKEQLIDLYSKVDLFVYNGTIKKEKDYAVVLLNHNKNLKVIDASLGMNYQDDVAQSWLNPANYLMMASNIKKGLEEYIDDSIEIKKIEDNYDELKLKLSQVDAELKSISNNASNKVLVVSSNTFKYLEKYGFTVISLQEDDNLTEKVISDVKKLLSNKMIQYIFLKDNEEENATIKALKEEYDFNTVSLNSLSTISSVEEKDKIDYMNIMMDNINSIKLEVNN